MPRILYEPETFIEGDDPAMRMKFMKPVPNMSQGTEESCPCAYGMYRLDARPMQGLNLNQGKHKLSPQHLQYFCIS